MHYCKRLLPLALLLLASKAGAQTQVLPQIGNGTGTTGAPIYCSVGPGCPMPTTGSAAANVTAIAGTQRGVTISSATALTIPAGATAALLSVQGTNNASGICAYWQDDGTNPTASAGQPIAALASMWYTIKTLPIKFIAATGATCTLNASYYQ